MRSLDDLDLAILAELERDGRIAVSELARRLGYPNSTIRDRIRKLEEEGVILRYTAVIDPRKLGLGIKAVIKVTRDRNVSLEDSLYKPAELLEVTSVQSLTGEIDELITVYARDVDDLKDIIYNKIGKLPGLSRLSTSIVLDEIDLPLIRRFRS
ncbi:MAG TPA: Lrp/AsnC family transcriptional regulator [Chloroflexi bacterium]|nr:Lrp/AsnC family transcriptional regulator [Chloroflexota bacterium]